MPAQLHLISTHPAGVVSEKRELDVVFVHGLGGHPFDTWRYGQDDSTSWPHWLAEEYGERIGVWSFGYQAGNSTAPRFGNQIKKAFGFKINKDQGFSMALPRRAGNALNRMVNNGIGVRPFVFIAHSLGGLLVKTVLRQANDAEEASDERRLINNCKAVLFLATPHSGSKLASLFSCLRICFPSITIEELRADDANLENLHQWYQGVVSSYRIQTRSFGESRPTANLTLVVPPSSANPGIAAPYGKNTVYLDVDHLQISRPEERDDDVIQEARKLINDQLTKDQLPDDRLDQDQLPLNPQILKSDLAAGSIPDPFPDTDFHLKVSVEKDGASLLQLPRQGSEGGASLACTVHASVYRGKAVSSSAIMIDAGLMKDSLSLGGDDPGPLIQHISRLLSQALKHCRAELGGSGDRLRLHLHLTLPVDWLSGTLPESILASLQRHVFFGCSNRSDLRESAVTQLLDQAMQVNGKLHAVADLHSGAGLSRLRWATLCHEAGSPAGFEQVFHHATEVLHLTAGDLDGELDGEDDCSHLVGRDALLATDSALLFADRFIAIGRSQVEESVHRRWLRLVEIGLPLVLWRRGQGSEQRTTNLDQLQVVLQGRWSDLCDRLHLLSKMINSQDQEAQQMQQLMRSLGIFYEDPLRYPPPPAPYRHPLHAPS